MSEKKLSERELYLNAIKQLSRDLKTNDYVSGTAQFTDMTNATYFLNVHGDKVRYCKPWKKFLVFNGRSWELDEYGYVQTMIDKMIREMYKGASKIKDPRLRIDFESHLKKSEALRRRDTSLASYTRLEEARITLEEMDNNLWLLNVMNGTIDLQTGDFKVHDPNDYITKCSKFVFEKNAVCSTWDRFLLQILNNDKDLITFVQKAMGYCLCADVSEQMMFILWGAGANGKTTFLNVISDLLGDYATSTQTETFVRKKGESLGNDIARLRGSRIVTTTELEQGKHFSESLIKQVTGNDAMTARFLYGEYFTFVPTFKIFMATNYKPVIKGSDYGIWRRIRLIPFIVTIPPEFMDRGLTEKLEAENSGILNWLLEGFRLWQKEGLTSPETVKKATQEYQEDMDTVGSFIKECCQIDASGTLRISNKQLYETYQNWANAHGEILYSQKFLAMRLQEKGFKKMMGNSERFWLGLGLKGVQ